MCVRVDSLLSDCKWVVSGTLVCYWGTVAVSVVCSLFFRDRLSGNMSGSLRMTVEPTTSAINQEQGRRKGVCRRLGT